MVRKMPRCLACEIHVLFRVVLRFSKDAVKRDEHLKTLINLPKWFSVRGMPAFSRFDDTFKITWLGTKYHTVVTLVIDAKLPNVQKKTIQGVVNTIKGLINGDDLEEGFIEVHECSDIIDLLPDAKGGVVCRVKRKK